jgi:hypothetical protein
MPNPLDTYIDRPLLNAMSRFLKLAYERIGVHPERVPFHAVSAVGVGLVVSGCSEISFLGGGRMFGPGGLVIGLAFVAVGLTGWFVGGKRAAAISDVWDARRYKSRAAAASLATETQFAGRLTKVVFVVVETLVLTANLRHGAYEFAGMNVCMLSLFAGMAFADYARAATPPDPDGGDHALSAAHSTG